MRHHALISVVAALSTAPLANAGIAPSDVFGLTINYSGGSWSIADNPGAVTELFLNDQGFWIAQGAASTADFDFEFSLEINPAFGVVPARGGFLTGSVVSALNFTNNTGMDDAFDITVTAAISTLSLPTVQTGSISGSLVSGDPLVQTAMLGVEPGEFLYTALADGMTARELVDDTFGASTDLTTPFGPFGFLNEPGPTNVSEIGVNHGFTLTNGDSVTFTSAYVLREIPAPGAAALFGLGGLAAARRRR